jgi:large subunit ribosomal protein L19
MSRNALLEHFENGIKTTQLKDKTIDKFIAGDTIEVHILIVEGTNSRVQIFTGTCTKIKNRGLGSSFTVRKVTGGIHGVERVMNFHSPNLTKIKLISRGIVRRANLNCYGFNLKIKQKQGTKK